MISAAAERESEREKEQDAWRGGNNRGTEVSINNPKLSTSMLERQQNAINNERKQHSRAQGGKQDGIGRRETGTGTGTGHGVQTSVSSRFRMISNE